jgi:predicted anti-sigma-YlaC factor YlaD
MHAYKILPYSNILLTSAFKSASLTFTLVIPSSLQLVQTALKLRFAEHSLAFKILLGVVILFAIIIPRYLNYCTVSISLLYTFITAVQLTNMALVLPTLITRLFLFKKLAS